MLLLPTGYNDCDPALANKSEWLSGMSDRVDGLSARSRM